MNIDAPRPDRPNFLSPATAAPPHFPRLWQGLGWGMVAAVVWLSLVPQPPEPPEFLAWDKAQHALAYAVLMFWFRQAFRPRLRWPLLLLGLGLGLEIMQGLGGVRTFDPHDMLANGLGVLLGWGLALTPLGRTLAVLDQRLAKLQARFNKA